MCSENDFKFKKMEYKAKTITVRKSTLLKIEKLAEKENRTFSNMVDTILTKVAERPDFFLNFK